MEQKRESLKNVTSQLTSLSDFISRIEQSMSIQVELSALEPQLRTALSSIRQSFEAVQIIHEEAIQSKNLQEQEKGDLSREVETLREKVQQLSSPIEEPKKPSKKKSKGTK